MEEEVVDPDRLQRLYAKARSDLLEKDEAMKKLSARLRAMEEGAAKLKTKVKAVEELRVLALEWEGGLHGLRQRNAELEVEKEGLASQLLEKRQALRTAEAATTHKEVASATLLKQLDELKVQNRDLTRQLKEITMVAEAERSGRVGLSETSEAQRRSLDAMAAERASLRDTVTQLQREVGGLRAELVATRGEKQHMQGDVQEARDLALREVVLRSEMAALRKDCARMLALLLDTQEYACFRQHWDDAQGLHYVTSPLLPNSADLPINDPEYMDADPDNGPSSNGPSPRRPRRRRGVSPSSSCCQKELQRLAMQYPPLDREVVEELKKEVKAWVPCRAVRLVRDFWVRHLMSGTQPRDTHSGVPPGALDRLLLDLNEVWGTREDIRVRRLKLRYEESLKELRRQVGQSRSYDSVVAQRLISRLRKEIVGLRRKVTQPRPFDLSDSSCAPQAWWSSPDGREAKQQDALRASLDTIDLLSKEVSRGSHDEQGEEGGGRAWVDGAEAGVGPGKREGVESRGGYRAARDGGEEFGEAKGGFLSGAAWVGKKAVAIVDEMGEEVDDSQRGSIERLTEQISLGSHGKDDGTAAQRQLARLLSHHHAVLLEVQSSTQTCRARIRELLLQATSGRLRL